MSIDNSMPALLIVTGLLFAPLTWAQVEDTPAQTSPAAATPTENDTSSSKEVEINEDNYRRYMELKDRTAQRNNLPVDAYQTRASLQKLESLPEDSQKHLRDQLREIIMQGDQWTPGDETLDYPYLPSEAARSNRQLERQEAEAWDELVGEYHQREAQIYKNSARSKAAMANASAGMSGSEGSSESTADAGSHDASDSNTGAGKDASGQDGEADQDRAQAAQDRRDEATRSAAGKPSSATDNADAVSTRGVSQNAMEFLMGQRNQANNSGGRQPASPQPPGDDPQQSSSSGLPELPDLGVDSGSQPESATATTDVRIESETADTYRLEGTLSISDLVNVKGVTVRKETGSTDFEASGTNPAPAGRVDKEEDEEDQPPTGAGGGG